VLPLFFVELLGVLVVNAFVSEQILPVEGIGRVGLRAIQSRDIPLGSVSLSSPPAWREA